MTQNPYKSPDSLPYHTINVSRHSIGDDTGLHSDSVIDAICLRHQILDDVQKRLLKSTLEFAARRYAMQKYQDAIDLSPAEIKKHFTSLRRAAKDMLKQLDTLPQLARNAVDKVEAELYAEFEDGVHGAIHHRENQNRSRMEQAGTAKFVVVHNGETPEGWQDVEQRLEYVAYRDIEAALNQLHLICETGLSQMQPEKGGRPDNKAVYHWTRIVSDFWVESLKRRYSVDGYKGEVVTDAGSFLTECMTIVDPTAIDLLYSQMRHYRDQLTQPEA